MAPRSRHSHASLMVILTILLFAGIGVFIAQTIATKQSLDAGARAGEKVRVTPRPTSTPNTSPTPLPTGKPEILGIYADTSQQYSAQTAGTLPETKPTQKSSRKIIQNSIIFTISGITLLLVAGFLLSSKTLLM